jgi:putative FmdB family regulatory protein
MATYEYLCLACEHPFEERRSMDAAVATALSCPSCGSERVRRRFSLFATGSSPAAGGGFDPAPGPSASGCCGGGGGCACGH